MMAYTYTYLGLNLVLFIAFVQGLFVARLCRFSPSPAGLGPITWTYYVSLTSSPDSSSLCGP